MRTSRRAPAQPGELLASLYGRAYMADPIDGAYGMTQAEVEKLRPRQTGEARRGDRPGHHVRLS